MNHDVPAAELHGLRERVTGVTDTPIAADDGIPIMADMSEGLDIEVISAPDRRSFRQTVSYSINSALSAA